MFFFGFVFLLLYIAVAMLSPVKKRKGEVERVTTKEREKKGGLDI